MDECKPLEQVPADCRPVDLPGYGGVGGSESGRSGSGAEAGAPTRPIFSPT